MHISTVSFDVNIFLSLILFERSLQFVSSAVAANSESSNEAPKSLFDQIQFNKDKVTQKENEEIAEAYAARVLNDEEVEFLDEMAVLQRKVELSIKQAELNEIELFHVS
jgi:hypothetical protein